MYKPQNESTKAMEKRPYREKEKKKGKENKSIMKKITKQNYNLDN